MPTCPRCTCTDCHSNKVENASFDQIAGGGALTARQAGHPAHVTSALLTWAGVEAINHFRDDWRCSYCGHTF